MWCRVHLLMTPEAHGAHSRALMSGWLVSYILGRPQESCFAPSRVPSLICMCPLQGGRVLHPHVADADTITQRLRASLKITWLMGDIVKNLQSPRHESKDEHVCAHTHTHTHWLLEALWQTDTPCRYTRFEVLYKTQPSGSVSTF